MNARAEISDTTVDVAGIARRARVAARVLATLSVERRNEILHAAAMLIEERAAEILVANERDCEQAGHAVEAGAMASALLDRLRTSERGISQMATQVRDVAGLPDSLGRKLAVTELDDGLTLHKVTCPLGVVGVIFEARPEVVAQVTALTIKSGNAVLLKGGAEASHTNQVLATVWRDALAGFDDVPVDAVNMLHTREDVAQMLKLHDEIDMIVPRGSNSFVRYVMEHSRIPVLGHGEGICHVYVDRAADLAKAESIAFDAKTQYPAACNAAETLLVHEAIAEDFLPRMVERFRSAGTQVRGCPRTLAIVSDASPATDEDWATEYSDLIIAVKVVGDLAEAVAHINRYGSKHTETIVTEDAAAVGRFMSEVDAASVFHNASTRFADGFRYGLGAELGISTSKLHARGPVGLEGLTTYKYLLFGNDHIVGDYTDGTRTFKHRKIKE